MEKYLDKTQRKLLKAIMNDDDETVLNLLKNGLDPNFSTSDLMNGESTPLHSAVRRNNRTVVRALLEYNANVDALDEDGYTPLYSALSSDIDREIRHILYEHGTNSNHTNKAGKTPLAQMLEDCTFRDIDFDREAVFELLNKSNNLISMNGLVFFVSNIHSKTESFNEETKHRCVEYLHILHEKGLDISKVSETGKNVLHSLASSCCYDCFEFITQNGIQIDAAQKDINGQTALHRLGVNPHHTGFSKCLDWLLEKGCGINDTDFYGRTIFHYVCNSNYTNENAIRILVDRGACATVTDNTELNCLHMSVLPSVINRQATDPEDVLPSKINVREVIETLLALELDVDTSDKTGFTPLHRSIRSKDVVVIKTLLQLGANPNLKTHTGESAVHRATIYKETFETLMKYSMYDLNINERDGFGSTPLHWAVKYLEKPAAKFLIEMGADTDLKDGLGYTARDIACSQRLIRFYDMFDIEEETCLNSAEKKEMENEEEAISLFSNTSITTIKNSQKQISVQIEDQETCVEVEDDYESNPESDGEEDDYCDVEECFGSNYIFQECPILSTIYYRKKLVHSKSWFVHVLQNHRIGLRKFIKTFVLDTKLMGMYFDTHENLQIAETIDKLMKRVANAVSNINPLLSCDISVAGSWAEGTKVTQPSEFDYKWTLIKFKEYFMPEQTMKPPLEYVRLKLRSDISLPVDSGLLNYLDSEGYLDSRNLIRDLYGTINQVLFCGDIIDKNLYLRRHLPVDKGSISHLAFRWVGMYYKDLLIDVDIVPAITFPNWRSELVNLNSHLANKYVQNIEQSIVFKAPPPRLIPSWNKLFRISMAEYEISILKNIPDAVRKGYIMLKSLKDTLYYPQVYDVCDDDYLERYLTTYVLKTCFLKVLEKALMDSDEIFDQPSDLKSDNVTITWANRILDFLETAITNCRLNSFFLDSVNLLTRDSVMIMNDRPIWDAEYQCLHILLFIGTKKLSKDFHWNIGQ